MSDPRTVNERSTMRELAERLLAKPSAYVQTASDGHPFINLQAHHEDARELARLVLASLSDGSLSK